MPCSLWNSWPSFGKYNCVCVSIIPGPRVYRNTFVKFFQAAIRYTTYLRWIRLKHSRPTFVAKYIYFFKPFSQTFWFAIRKIFICHFGNKNEQHFAANRSVAIHFHIAFRINSQSELTLICNWFEMNELRFFCSELVLWLAEKRWVAPIELVTLQFPRRRWFSYLFPRRGIWILFANLLSHGII